MSRTFIPPHQWGRDHWTTLRYIETCVVDHTGVLAGQHMRCDLKRHPLLAHECQPDGGIYPTRLNDGSLVSDHDDYDCLLDFAAAGLLKIIAPNNWGLRFVVRGARGPVRTIDIAAPGAVRVALTDTGWAVCAALRKHRGGGNSLDTFRVQYAVVG